MQAAPAVSLATLTDLAASYSSRVHRPDANGLAFQRHVGIVYPAEYDDFYHCYQVALTT